MTPCNLSKSIGWLIHQQSLRIHENFNSTISRGNSINITKMEVYGLQRFRGRQSWEILDQNYVYFFTHAYSHWFCSITQGRRSSTAHSWPGLGKYVRRIDDTHRGFNLFANMVCHHFSASEISITERFLILCAWTHFITVQNGFYKGDPSVHPLIRRVASDKTHCEPSDQVKTNQRVCALTL